jgi:hypothetical protein
MFLLCFYSVVSYQCDPFNPVDDSGRLADPLHPWHYMWVDIMNAAVANRLAIHNSIG